MLQIRFYQFTSKQNSKGEAPIYMRINGLEKELNLSTNIFQMPKYWDKRKNKFKTSCPNSNYLNSLIQNSQDKVWKYVKDCTILGQNITAESLKKYLGNKEVKVETKSLLLAFDHFISSNIKIYASGTIRHYKADRKVLEEFIKTRFKDHDRKLTEVNFEFLSMFQSYLIEVRKNKPNTIGKHIQRIRAVINYSIMLNWITEDNTKRFKIRSEPTSRITLSADEILSIEKLDLKSNPRLEITRDLFLFMVQTGLSYSDLCALSRQNIHNEGTLLRISRRKSKESCMVPLFAKTQNLLNKYTNHPVAVYNSKCFPKVCNQVLNRRLKEIARLSGIDKHLTCHIARHTFACLSLDNRVPLESISKVLGHTNLKTTQIYAKVSAAKIEADFKVLNNIFG